MNEYELDYNTFIGGWFIPENVVDGVLSLVKKNKDISVPGIVSGGLIKEIKDSEDIKIAPDYSESEILEYRNYLQKCLELYVKRYETVNSTNDKFNITEPIIYQYYKPGGGFKMWHNERGGIINSKRLLVFMTYLNDVDDGGTLFKNVRLTTPAKKGLTLIWPTDWPWAHKSQISYTKEKHIITGWYNFI